LIRREELHSDPPRNCRGEFDASQIADPQGAGLARDESIGALTEPLRDQQCDKKAGVEIEN
jgi:hypothetical protein